MQGKWIRPGESVQIVLTQTLTHTHHTKNQLTWFQKCKFSASRPLLSREKPAIGHHHDRIDLVNDRLSNYSKINPKSACQIRFQHSAFRSRREKIFLVINCEKLESQLTHKLHHYLSRVVYSRRSYISRSDEYTAKKKKNSAPKEFCTTTTTITSNHHRWTTRQDLIFFLAK